MKTVLSGALAKASKISLKPTRAKNDTRTPSKISLPVWKQKCRRHSSKVTGALSKLRLSRTRSSARCSCKSAKSSVARLASERMTFARGLKQAWAADW